MGTIAVSVQDLGKEYVISAKKDKKFSLLETIVDGCKEPFQNIRRFFSFRDSQSATSFWALQHVSFDIGHGEVVGIIGPNGAGKSTLLKILSRVLEPTTGQCILYGRCGTLLEVGMGFHPELTGRENIYLSGAILGLKKAEVDKRFDLIVDFSGVERFIDTPVKHYSSGMYVRLAFSVAAQLDPEILIIDEVLAVGDQVFQAKCFERIHQIAKEGRTVLFVSHDPGSIKLFCNRVLMLMEGRLIEDGPAEKVLGQYLDLLSKQQGEPTA